MIPFRALLLQRLICSAWSIGAIALVTAGLMSLAFMGFSGLVKL